MTYGSSLESGTRWSPCAVYRMRENSDLRNPDRTRICTSRVERLNLTVRMQVPRLTRLTNAFSKKWQKLRPMLALYFAWYNFCRTHQTLRITPAMEARITDHIWSIQEIIRAARGIR